MKIGFIGFGEAARAYQDSLAAQEPGLAFSAYDKLLDGEATSGAMVEAMQSRGVAIYRSSQEAVSGQDWIVSAVTADQSETAAREAAPHLRPGQVFFDINSVSPGVKRQNAERICANGAHYVDMAVMAPVHPRAHRTPVLIAGPVCRTLGARLAELDFSFEIVSDEVGAATAIKMVRSLFVKGLEAITVETLLAASASGCLPYIMNSLSQSFPGLGWPGFAHYHFERTLKHGKRRAAEMRESAATIDALSLHAPLAEAIAAIQDKMGAIGGADFETEKFEAVLASLAKERRGEKS